MVSWWECINALSLRALRRPVVRALGAALQRARTVDTADIPGVGAGIDCGRWQRGVSGASAGASARRRWRFCAGRDLWRRRRRRNGDANEQGDSFPADGWHDTNSCSHCPLFYFIMIFPPFKSIFFLGMIKIIIIIIIMICLIFRVHF